MTTEVLLFGALLVAAFYYVRGGADFAAQLKRATIACLAIGLAIYLLF